MPHFLDRLGAALLDASLAATAIAGLVVLAMIQCRQPVRRRDWARACLISTLALLPLAGLNPVPRIDVRIALHALFSSTPDEPSPPPRRWGEIRDAPPAPAEGENPNLACPPGPPGWPRLAARGLVVAYLVGASIGLGGLVLGVGGSTWLVRNARSPSTWALALHRSLPFGSTWRRPRLLVSGRVTRPVLVGWLRPTILIPPDLDGPGMEERLRLSLLHELAHAENLDHMFAPLEATARSAWFFLPPVWWVLDQMRLDQEFLADRRAVVHFGTSGAYASSLVDLASPARAGAVSGGRASRTDGFDPKTPGVASALFHRVTMLVRCPFDLEGRTPLWWRWSTALTLTLATLAASCLTLRGMAGWSSPPDTPPDPVARSYRQPDLTLTSRPNDDQPFDLRFRLPDRFVLTFEVMAEPADLPGIEVLGHRLGDAASIPDPGRAAYRLWHRVRIERSKGVEGVEVDGRPLSANPRHQQPDGHQARQLADDPPGPRDHRPAPRSRTRLVSPEASKFPPGCGGIIAPRSEITPLCSLKPAARRRPP